MSPKGHDVDNTTFHARKVAKADGQCVWQTLEDHLLGTADRSAAFADAFGSHEWGRTVGLWHDLGKYLPAFQQYLRDGVGSVEHSGAGAALAFEKSKEHGVPVAFAIAAHHTGLANLESSDGDPKPLKQRLKENETALRCVRRHADEAILDRNLPSPPTFLTGRSGERPERMRRRWELWTRFLFSALVDADRLDSEHFSEPDTALRRGGFLPIPELARRLDAHIDGMVKKLSVEQRSSRVNVARAHVLEACQRASDLPPGVFSLTVPTGGGKTLSAMSFALRHAARHGLRRVIVVIPFTSIIEQNAEEYRKALGVENVIEHHSNLDPEQQRTVLGEGVAQQHDLAAENWDAPVVVTTTVQFFESLFSNRPSQSRKVHNIARSVVILDEVQTLPPEFLLSIVEVVGDLASDYGCSVVLSTATPPALAARDGFQAGLRDIQPIIECPAALVRQLSRVEYVWPATEAPPVQWETLAVELAGHRRVLAVVHRRHDARALAEQIRRLLPEERVFHLSALMCAAHRSDVLREVKSTLASGAPCRLVSTQLVEAGVDIDFPVVYRALGGLDNMVQAAGRCNREGRSEKGRVIIFRSPTPPPPGTPRRGLDATESLLRQGRGTLDADDPALIDAYFRMLYHAEDLDAKQIQTHRQQFDFAIVGRDFRLIEDGFACPIIVPYGEAPKRLNDLRIRGPSRETLRALQPFIVNIYPVSFERLRRSGAFENVAETVVALTSVFAGMYDTVFGLREGDDASPAPEALMV